MPFYLHALLESRHAILSLPLICLHLLIKQFFLLGFLGANVIAARKGTGRTVAGRCEAFEAAAKPVRPAKKKPPPRKKNGR